MIPKQPLFVTPEELTMARTKGRIFALKAVRTCSWYRVNDSEIPKGDLMPNDLFRKINDQLKAAA